ncbi:hypothetical protein BT96DRAFT_300826 [Gymnopus androsaceus JB14]|uniref:Uncharacterized protein n=1 Tax=Gymnopus androsaceus JB14 TaxID=1447944 RepID=A0A6A4GA65_9AGAR|nr:hypothetical protein BT96DRAFT_300826 [Gymnopus androsaceus JB14]
MSETPFKISIPDSKLAILQQKTRGYNISRRDSKFWLETRRSVCRYQAAGSSLERCI